MNVFLIEDEEVAATRMQKMLRQLEPGLHIAGVADSIESSVNWLSISLVVSALNYMLYSVFSSLPNWARQLSVLVAGSVVNWSK